MPQYFYLTIIAAALLGFLIAYYIYAHKKSGRKLTCPINSDCEVVVRSRYSTLFGVTLEKWGMLYYAAVILFYLGLIFWPTLARPTTGLATALATISALIALASVFAFLLSLYLTYIQMAKLREWCVWCLGSALVSTVIFLALIGLWLTT